MTTPMKPNRPDLPDSVGDIRVRVRTLEALSPTYGPLNWIPITSFQSNWLDAAVSGEPSCAYAITPQGWVVYRGRVRDGILGDKAFTQPAGALIESDEVFVGDRLQGGVAKLQVLSTGEVIPLLDATVGFPDGVRSDDGTFYATGAETTPGIVNTSSTSAADMWGNTKRYHLSGASTVSLLSVFAPSYPSLTPIGFGIASSYGGSLPISGGPVHALQLPYYGGPYADSWASLTVSDAACSQIDLGVRCRAPFMGNGDFPAPVGWHFEIAASMGGAMRIYHQAGDASQGNLATGTSPGFSVSDVISFQAIGDTLTAYVNGASVLTYDLEPDGFYASGLCSFGINGSTKGIILATEFEYGAAPGGSFDSGLGQSIALNQITYPAFA